MPAWFEAHSLTDIYSRCELQKTGLMESVEYLRGVIEHEIQVLNGASEKLLLGGISQGAATGLWALLRLGHPIGGFVGASAWLPFSKYIMHRAGSTAETDERDQSASDDAQSFVDEMLGSTLPTTSDRSLSGELTLTPVLMGHGSDDAYVDIELGREVQTTLQHIGFEIEWKEYSGADEEGHWLKEPEQVDDISAFIQRAIGLVETTSSKPSTDQSINSELSGPSSN